jgi:hypothetical protein
VTGDFNSEIRRAAGLPAERLEPATEQPVGSIGIGVGGAAQAPRRDPHDAINEQLRTAWKAYRGLITIGDVIP